MKAFLFVISTFFLGSNAYSKVNLNSMCYVLNRSGASMEGENAEHLFEVASVSKLATAYWSLRELGPFYKFRTRIHITSVSKNLFDVHIEGGKDPFWGRQLTHYLFSELNRLQITRIRQLSFDENLIFRWSVLTNFIEPFKPTPDEIVNALRAHIQNLPTEYPRTRQEAFAAGMQLPKTLSLQAQNIIPLAFANFQATPNTRTYIFSSAPLFKYLKEVNRVSNNHVADNIFDFLGGVLKFNEFVARDMQLDSGDIQFINGSGNSVIGKDANGVPVKEYNKATCASMLKVIIKLDSELKTHNMGLKDIMAVSGTETSTLNPRYDSIPNTLIGKTGTVDPAITMVGVISTAEGDVYFGIFTGTEGAADWGNARDLVRTKVFDLMGRYGGAKSFKYAARPFMPFDKNSGLKQVTARIRNLP